MALTEAFLLPFFIWTSFRIMGVARTQGALRSWADRNYRREPQTRPTSVLIESACRAQNAVRRIAGMGGTCLVRSLTLWTMLRKRGVETDIRIGMRRADGRIEGHAWLEYRGQPLNESASVIETHSALPEPAMFDLWHRRS